MITPINPSHTLYAIHLHLSEKQTIVVGKLGIFEFEKGTYIYTGSAKRNILSRINRHITVEKPLKWHIDYLREYCEITKIITYDNMITECLLAEKIRKDTGGMFPIFRFGSTDCKCFSHLIFVGDGVLSGG